MSRVVSLPRVYGILRAEADVRVNVFVIKVKNIFEKLSPAEEEARLRVVYLEDHYDRKLSLSEFVHRCCEDVKQPMEDEEGPIQLRLAQHSPIRMRCRLLKDVSPEDHDDQEDEEVDSMEDKLPKIPTKPNASFNRSHKPTVGESSCPEPWVWKQNCHMVLMCVRHMHMVERATGIAYPSGRRVDPCYFFNPN
jgi:hypothetical protein